MCKLNILCSKNDGECTCELINQKLVSESQPKNGLLCSILSLIKSQPDIMKSLLESSNNPASGMTHINPETLNSDLGDSSPTRSSSNESSAEYSVSIINDLPNKYLVGHGFSLMAEVVDKNLLKIQTNELLDYQIAVVSKEDGKDFELLGEVSTTGVALFRRLVIREKWKSALLQVRVKDRPDICQFNCEIFVRAKKGKSVGVKE